jgi:hypothetical protein
MARQLYAIGLGALWLIMGVAIVPVLLALAGVPETAALAVGLVWIVGPICWLIVTRGRSRVASPNRLLNAICFAAIALAALGYGIAMAAAGGFSGGYLTAFATAAFTGSIAIANFESGPRRRRRAA